eukprot:2094839-Amphidinium_carterae.1
MSLEDECHEKRSSSASFKTSSPAMASLSTGIVVVTLSGVQQHFGFFQTSRKRDRCASMGPSPELEGVVHMHWDTACMGFPSLQKEVLFLVMGARLQAPAEHYVLIPFLEPLKDKSGSEVRDKMHQTLMILRNFMVRSLSTRTHTTTLSNMGTLWPLHLSTNTI